MGIDATRFYTVQDGWCWFFGAVDHYCDVVVGWHVAKLGDRWATLGPLQQGAREILSGFVQPIRLAEPTIIVAISLPV